MYNLFFLTIYVIIIDFTNISLFKKKEKMRNFLFYFYIVRDKGRSFRKSFTTENEMEFIITFLFNIIINLLRPTFLKFNNFNSLFGRHVLMILPLFIG